MELQGLIADLLQRPHNFKEPTQQTNITRVRFRQFHCCLNSKELQQLA